MLQPLAKPKYIHTSSCSPKSPKDRTRCLYWPQWFQEPRGHDCDGELGRRVVGVGHDQRDVDTGQALEGLRRRTGQPFLWRECLLIAPVEEGALVNSQENWGTMLLPAQSPSFSPHQGLQDVFAANSSPPSSGSVPPGVSLSPSLLETVRRRRDWQAHTPQP